MEEKIDDHDSWQISELYSRAWQILKRNKVLWIFGIASTAIGFQSGHVSNPGSSSSTGTGTTNNILQNLPNSSFQGFSANPAIKQIEQIFTSVPVGLYIALAIGVALLFLLGIILNIVFKAWSQSALLKGIEDGIDSKPVSIQSSSMAALPTIKPLVWLNVVPSLILFLSGGLVIGILAVFTAAAAGALKAVPIILIFLSAVTFLMAAIYLNLTKIWASRLVVLEKKTAVNSLALGYKTAKKKFWAMSLLALVNTILGVVITIIPVIFIAIFGISGIMAFQSNKTLAIGLLIPAGLVLFLFILTSSIFGGILNAFKAIVWSLAFRQIKDEFND